MARVLSAAALAAMLGIAGAVGPAAAQDTVKIGILFPLSGNAASAGSQAKAAVEVAVDIINTPHEGLGNVVLSAGQGLPNLKGAKIELVSADHQGNPSVGQSQALRLITQDHVVALQGAYQSSVTFAATATAERYGIPWIVGDFVASNITTRGFKWVFRVTPVAQDFANGYMAFLSDLKKSGHPVNSIGIVYENTDYGTSIADNLRIAAKAANLPITADVSYSANTTDVAPQVLQLKEKNPDAVIFVSYTSDAILYTKTMRSLDYLPKIVIGDDFGFSDPTYIKNVGSGAQGVLNRSSWDAGKPGSPTYKINELFKAKTGYDMDDTSARNMQAFFVLADAINRAGSTAPEAIQKALQTTDLKPDQLMIGYKGVKFDETGQNTEGSTYLIQLQGDQYVAVWPEKAATAKLIDPFKGWK